MGQIRNKVAHEQNPINRHQLDNLIVLVDRMLLDSTNPESVSKRTLQLFVKMPGEVIALGSHGDMYDFILAVGTAYHGATIIVVKNIALKSVSKNIIAAEK